MAFTYSRDGQRVDASAIGDCPVIATGPDLSGDRETVYLFADDSLRC
jgi:hypothetical protein